MKEQRISFTRDEATLCSYASRTTESALERMRGLLFSAPLKSNEAMKIAPCNSVHSLLMGYPIDVIYVDKKNTVCHLVPNMSPWRISASFRAAFVVELAAGEIFKYKIQVGDLCQCEDH